ncbi:MAG: DUF898 family protein [Pseudomonadota bacterium]
METVRARYSGDRSTLFDLAAKSGLLTILTLGIYRFWMVTKLRQFYWSAIQIEGDPLEYTGRALEKLLGFLIALVILAIYLGVVNILLTFLGLSVTGGDPLIAQLAINLSILATLPLIFYAQYRGTSYVLARTSWRGIRFGLKPGAWGYTMRALGLVLLSIVTFGIMYPYQHFKLSKYITDRAAFGSQSFVQEGRWTLLLKPWLAVWGTIIGGAILIGGLASSGSGGSVLVSLLGVALYVVIFFVSTRYFFVAFQKIWSHKRLGETRFTSKIDPTQCTMITAGGAIMVGLASIVIAGLIGAAGYLLGTLLSDVFTGSVRLALPVGLASILGYLSMIVVAFALSNVLITHRIMAQKVGSMEIENLAAMAQSQQRAREEATEAGGFADALNVDVGIGV